MSQSPQKRLRTHSASVATHSRSDSAASTVKIRRFISRHCIPPRRFPCRYDLARIDLGCDPRRCYFKSIASLTRAVTWLQSGGESVPIVLTIDDRGSVTRKARNADGTRRPADRQSFRRWSVGALALAVWLVTRP